MMKFYSEKLGIEYPWQKYNQIVGRDYVSGAMENTTATLHQESAYQNFRQLADENSWETVICHELFHQWFGDLVTTESWSNITVNESMADYSQTLWMEYKHGKDAGDRENFNGMNNYFQDPASAKKNLVRFYYADKEDVFDLVSYQKGGRILHMLRNYVGDDAFFKSLNNYLTTNKFKNGESDQMRLAFEEVTGQDLSWYWNQWYFGSGHPIVKIDYAYDDAAGKATITIEQTQKTDKVFRLPLAVDVYNGSVKKRYHIWMEEKKQSFTIPYTQHPDLINVDGDKVTLWMKTDNKTSDNFIHQWKYAPLYMDRKEALDYFAKNNMKELVEGLKDKFGYLRRYAAQLLANAKFAGDADVLQAAEAAIAKEDNRTAKAAELDLLVKSGDAKYLSLFKKNVDDSSYSVAASALQGLAQLDPDNSYTLAKKYSKDAKGDLVQVISGIIIEKGTEADFDIVLQSFDDAPLSQEKVGASATFAGFLEKVQDISKVKRGIDVIIKFRNQIPEQYRGFTDPPMKAGLDKLSKAKGTEIADYIKSVWK
ncbi:M1 family metallopeptidase [Ferruginibacter sp.]